LIKLVWVQGGIRPRAAEVGTAEDPWASALEAAPESIIIKAAKDSANNTVSIDDLPFIVKGRFISFHLLSSHQRNPFLGLLVVALVIIIVEGGR
jgi:hypothetical protein